MKKMVATVICAAVLSGIFGAAAWAEAFITVDPSAVLPEPSLLERAYPATLIRGERSYDLPFLLDTLLGEGYETKARNEYSYADEYQSTREDKPRRWVHVYDDETFGFGYFSYYDGMVTGERGGEYEPPAMNMTREESLTLCRVLLNGIVDGGWLAHPGMARTVQERWSYADRWMSDAEYDQFVRKQDAHRFAFEHWTDDGICILEDGLWAIVGVNGLAGLDIGWHDFTAAGKETATLMPLEEAIAMANSTRSAPTVLLMAQPVYSNWLTDRSDTFHLSWYLVTSEGNYVVDCVLGEHMCDSYEY